MNKKGRPKSGKKEKTPAMGFEEADFDMACVPRKAAVIQKSAKPAKGMPNRVSGSANSADRPASAVPVH